MKWLAVALLFALTPTASACDRVEYAEAKTWTAEKLHAAYCADLAENTARLEAKLAGTMGYDRADAELCRQQRALYKRLLDERHSPVKSCKP